MILQRLREAATKGKEGLGNGMAFPQFVEDPFQYIQFLTRLYGFFSHVEPKLAPWSGYFGDHRLEKTDWLCDDLLELGVCANELKELAELPVSMDFRCPAEALGCMYVIENEVQDGRYMRDHIVQSGLGLPYRYLDGYGMLATDEWIAFLNTLEQYAVLHGDDASIIDSVTQTYGHLASWLQAEREPQQVCT